MEKFSRILDIPVRLQWEGKGEAVLLLHGYLETLEVWDEFAAALSKHCKVIRLDLPGHGFSGTKAEINSMDDMAKVAREVLREAGEEKAHLLGHSMGGYVALAFASQFPEATSSLCLFHSTPYADTPEKKEKRQREIELIAAGKLPLLLDAQMTQVFADENVGKFEEKIADMQGCSMAMEAEGVMASIRGLGNREDRQEFLRGFKKDLLFVFGAKDNFIGSETTEKMKSEFPHAQVLDLEHSGHCGFVEEKDKSVQALLQFWDLKKLQ